MALRIRIYDGSSDKTEFDCDVRELYDAIEEKNKGRKKRVPLVIGQSPEVYELQVEPILVISIGGRS